MILNLAKIKNTGKTYKEIFVYVLFLTGNNYYVGLTGDVESIIQWARQKRAEEFEYERLAKAHPAVKDLLNQIKDKEEQIKMIMTLVKNPANDGPIELMGS